MSLKEEKLKLLQRLHETISDFDMNMMGDNLDDGEYDIMCDFIEETREKLDELENQIYTETVLEERYG